MQSIPEEVTSVTMGEVSLPRFEDGTINLQELFRQLAEDVTDEIMDAGAERLCRATGTSRNGYRLRKLVTCVGELTPGVPKLREGSFFPEDLLERYGRADCAVVAAVSETCATGTSTRKVGRIMSRMGVGHVSKDQAGSMARTIDAEVKELMERPVDGPGTPTRGSTRRTRSAGGAATLPAPQPSRP